MEKERWHSLPAFQPLPNMGQAVRGSPWMPARNQTPTRPPAESGTTTTHTTHPPTAFWGGGGELLRHRPTTLSCASREEKKKEEGQKGQKARGEREEEKGQKSEARLAEYRLPNQVHVPVDSSLPSSYSLSISPSLSPSLLSVITVNTLGPYSVLCVTGSSVA